MKACNSLLMSVTFNCSNDFMHSAKAHHFWVALCWSPSFPSTHRHCPRHCPCPSSCRPCQVTSASWLDDTDDTEVVQICWHWWWLGSKCHVMSMTWKQFHFHRHQLHEFQTKVTNQEPWHCRTCLLRCNMMSPISSVYSENMSSLKSMQKPAKLHGVSDKENEWIKDHWDSDIAGSTVTQA